MMVLLPFLFPPCLPALPPPLQKGVAECLLFCFRGKRGSAKSAGEPPIFDIRSLWNGYAMEMQRNAFTHTHACPSKRERGGREGRQCSAACPGEYHHHHHR